MMFKKILLIVLALCLISASASAAGKLTVVQERMIAMDYYGSAQVEVFAEVTNTGDNPIEYSAGLVEIFDAEGNTIDSTDYVYCYPLILAPGETGYVFTYIYPDTVTADDIADYSLIVTGKGTTDDPGLLSATGTYEVSEDSYWMYYSMIAEITNTTEETVFDPYCVFALKDADGQLLYVDYTGAYSVGIPAGGTIFLEMTLYDSLIEYYNGLGIEPASADVIAFKSPYSY